MKFSLLLNELKIFSKCIHSLSKLGDYIYFEYESCELSLRSVNSSRSAFARFQFKTDFFETINELPNYKFICKVTANACLSVFRASNLWKNVERCKITIRNETNELIFHMFCHNGVSETHQLRLVECESLEAKYSLFESKNRLTLSTKILMEVLNNFQNSQQRELLITVNANECIFKTYLDMADLLKAVTTRVHFRLSDFEDYNIVNGIEIIITLKELKAALSFGEQSNYKVCLSYSEPCKPLIIAYSEPSFKAHFVLATLCSNNIAANASFCDRMQKSSSTICQADLMFDDDTDISLAMIADEVQREQQQQSQIEMEQRRRESYKHISCQSEKENISIVPQQQGGLKLFSSYFKPAGEQPSPKCRRLNDSERILVPDSDEEN